MTVTITVGEIVDVGLWERACRVLGIDPYARNEGRLDRTDSLTLTHEQAFEMNLVTIAPPITDPQPRDFT